MNSRERLIRTLNHQEPDRVPVDLGATFASGIAAGALVDLRTALQLSKRPVKVYAPMLMLGHVEADVLEALGGDVVGLWGAGTNYYRTANWKPWTMPDGTEVLVGGEFAVTEDAEGTVYVYPQGDTNVAPSSMMPSTSYFFDHIIRQEPIDEANLNGRTDFADQFKVYSDADLLHFQRTADDLYRNTDYGIVGVFFGGSFGDAGVVPGAGLKKTPGIRKTEDWLIAHLEHPGYIKEVYDLQFEVAMKNLELYRQAVGDKIQVIGISGTDFGTQGGEFISPDLFREFYKPYYTKINAWVHQHTSWKTFYHTCGSVVRLLDDFVEMGMDILNPVQCSAKGMDPRFLKENYGDRLTFWGGAVDTQHTLAFGTPEEVRQQARERLEIFSKGGGFVFNAIHNIVRTTPTKNILALYEAARAFNEGR